VRMESSFRIGLIFKTVSHIRRRSRDDARPNADH
jgi:hypothetical protein